MVSLIAATVALAEDSPSGPTLADLEWLVGHWAGEGFGGLCEEIWSPASGGSMMGMFKLSVDGETQFYELFTVVPDSTGLPIRLKHFNRDLIGWEDKDSVVTFGFGGVSDGRLELDGLVYERVGEDSLYITVSIAHTEGEKSEEIIRCARVEW